jgi:quinol monooxygenase YgiN
VSVAQFPWNQRKEIEEQHDYVLMSSFLLLKRYQSIPGFLRDALAIRRQLRTVSGLVGYALLAELPQKTFWTFSVWEDRASLDAFASSNPHGQIIRRLTPKMGRIIFKFFNTNDSGLPWAWDIPLAQ